jgi:hypothetical protein
MLKGTAIGVFGMFDRQGRNGRVAVTVGQAL